VRSHHVAPWPATISAPTTSCKLLGCWNETDGKTLFSNNVDLDQPLEKRKESIADAMALIGGLNGNVDSIRTPSASQLSWNEMGEEGHLNVFIQLTPENPPVVQTMNITTVQYPKENLRLIAQSQFEIASSTASALDGPLALTNEYVRGDGTSHVTQVAHGVRGTWHYTVKINPVTEEVLESTVTLAPTNETHFIN